MDPKYPGTPGGNNSGFGNMNTGAGKTGVGPSGNPMGASSPMSGSRSTSFDEEQGGGGFDINMLTQRAEEIGERLGQLVRDRPITCLLCALGAGYIVGRILRA